MLKKHYANVCFLLAIICFMLDGLSLFPTWHLMSWGSAAFTAGFVAWELIANEEQEKHDKAVEEIAKHASPEKAS
jgi:hypothetical protein